MRREDIDDVLLPVELTEQEEWFVRTYLGLEAVKKATVHRGEDGCIQVTVVAVPKIIPKFINIDVRAGTFVAIP